MTDPANGIVLDGLSMTYQRRGRSTEALSSIDLTVPQGDRVSLIGPSGCGKSTVLKILADLVPPTAGTALVGGTSPARARADRAYALVSQQSSMLPWRKLATNVGLGLEVAGMSRAERRRRVDEALELVGLRGFENAYPHELSGGMRQRGAIARALALRPRVLLMDEPFGAIDEINRENLNFELLRILEEISATLVLITHSVAEAVILSDTVVVMSARPGRIVHTEPIPFGHDRTRAIRHDPRFAEIETRLRDQLADQHAPAGSGS